MIRNGRFSFILEALERMVVSGCAPGLRQLRIYLAYQSLGIHLAGRGQPGAKGPLEGLPPRESEPILRHSSYPAIAPAPTSSRPGTSRIDFRARRRFELYYGVSVQALRTLASRAASNNLRSLREPGLTVSSDDCHEKTTAYLDQPGGLFLQAIRPPLEALRLGGRFGRHAFEAVLRFHGHALRKVHLFPRMMTMATTMTLMEMETGVHGPQQRCPRLQDVGLRVRRRQGGPGEE
ncbi:hypothetical protein VTK56DRAFT_8433 [Thermocarpiscus australiensis]